MKNFRLVATFTYPHEYLVLKFLLEKEDIPFVFENETMVDISPFYSNALGGIRLLVPEAYVEYVIELINDLNAPSSPLRVV
ncbi:DUF2007 domain-containing protein [Robertkochia marina]|uniref:DUF2007 domain-containing protein n=1 Tax=Robertkochia marina TaxID=1227945 RepID=UPI00118020D3|nr:DUF2007 domain-containing protein [Robertkochia marina]TRZ47435.1 DUF2007 domain-containing protein [Robertkochia marina]